MKAMIDVASIKDMVAKILRIEAGFDALKTENERLRELLKEYVGAGGNLYADDPEWERLATLAKKLIS